MKKTLSVMAVCGMCNRLRAVVSGMRLAEFTGRQYECIWDSQPNCNIHYNDQFETKIDVMRSSDWCRRMAIRCSTGITIKSYGAVFEGTTHTSRIMRGIVVIGDESVATIEAGNWFFHRDDNFLPDFERQRELYRRHVLHASTVPVIDKIYADLSNGQRMIGVHIRGTDNAHCIEHSPIASFIPIIDKKLNGTDRILLATDDVDAVNILRARYGNRLHVPHMPPASRDSIQGMKIAIRDLYLLARCDVIIGSCGSTFSNMAMGLAKTNDLTIAHGPLKRETPRVCCEYGYYNFDWFRSVVQH